MSSRYVVRNGDRDQSVTVTEVGNGYRVTIDGESIAVDCRPGGGIVRSLLIDGKSFEVSTMSSRDGMDVYVSGDVYRVRVADELWARAVGAAKAPAPGEEKILSPMPGAVVAIRVAEGQIVRPGDIVAVVEAMKMQNDLAATQGGKVVAIHAKPGDVVDQDAVLVVLFAGEGTS